MKKILKPLAGFMFAGFLIGMFFLVISLTFSALGRIFPDNFTNQIVGLVLFDLAALTWGLAFVYKSASTAQYAISAIGFLVGLAGTFVMIASEVMLSAQGLTDAPDWLGRALTYTFIGASALHLSLGYAHAAASPDVDAAIRLGASQAEITSEAIAQAEQELESKRAALGSVIRPRLVAGIKRNLNLPLLQAEFDALPDDTEIIEAKPKAQGVPVTLWNAITGKRKKARKPVTTTYEQRADLPNPTKPEQGETESERKMNTKKDTPPTLPEYVTCQNPNCDKQIRPGRFRKRKYCNNACKQEAYRIRRDASVAVQTR